MRTLRVWSLITGFCVATVVPAHAASVPRAEKYQYSSSARAVQPAPEQPEPKIWELSGSFGVEHDNNINHLLTNLDINSNRRLPDTVLLTEAGVAAFPMLLDGALDTEFSYTYNRYDYQTNTSFSYYDHELA